MDAVETMLTEELAEPVEIGAEAYISADYAREEGTKLWPKIWQMACREEEIPETGDYVTYDILDDTIIVVRSGPGEIKAFYNVCAHRGLKLVEGCGHAKVFRCPYHAWRYDLHGKNTYLPADEQWCGTLDEARKGLVEVRADAWGGWVWVNMDPDCIPLREYLEPAASMLDPFQLENMRYRWRMWCYFPSNWKTALEAFLESYHVEGTHPQLLKFADYHPWSKAQGIHSNSGFGAERKPAAGGGKLDDDYGNTLTRPGKGKDARISIAKLQEEIWTTTDGTTTQTLVDAAKRLVNELPEATPPGEVMAHWLKSAKADDAARGVFWPEIDPKHVAKAGSSWFVFPNVNIIQGLSNALYYRARPHGFDPDSCIFEVACLEQFPPGKAPETQWVHADPVTERSKWPPVLLQDFDNMARVQKGMRSRGFRSAIPNPQQERKVANFHRVLAQYMGRGAPRPVPKD